MLIPLDSIADEPRLRGISEATVEALVNSIADVGLLNPITVYRRMVYVPGGQVEGYGLIAGLHRKTAYERLGLTEIEATVLDLDDLHRQIAECDENLCGPQLTPADRALFTRRRKEAYEALHGKPKAIGAAAAHEAMGHNFDANAKSAVAFTEDTAASTGAAVRTVQRDAERGDKISDDALAAVRGTDLDTGVYLDKLKKLSVTEQLKAVRSELAERKARPRALSRVADAPLDDDDARERQVAVLMSAWNKASAEARAEFLERIHA